MVLTIVCKRLLIQFDFLPERWGRTIESPVNIEPAKRLIERNITNR